MLPILEISISDYCKRWVGAYAYIALVATFLGAVKGILLLAVVAPFSSSLFRLVMDADVEVYEVGTAVCDHACKI